MVERCFYTAEAVGPIPTPPTTNELDDFLEAEMRDARSASQGFPPNFPNEFGAPPSAVRTVFSPSAGSSQTQLFFAVAQAISNNTFIALLNS